jgi:UrcA family protein
MKPLIASFGFALALCAVNADCPATPALSDDGPVKQIHYADLNLSRATDVDVLYRRIEGAASLVCDVYAARDLARNLRFRHCMADAIDRAVADVHAPLLSQRHAALTKRQTVPPQAMRLDP